MHRNLLVTDIAGEEFGVDVWDDQWSEILHHKTTVRASYSQEWDGGNG